MKHIIGTVTVMTTVVIGVGIAYLALVDGGPDQPEPRYTTQAALKGAAPARAADTLRERGHTLAGPLVCRDLPGVTKDSLRLSCSGTTTGKKKVQLIAATELEQHGEYFTILVSGRPLVQNATCLGTDCRKDKSKD